MAYLEERVENLEEGFKKPLQIQQQILDVLSGHSARFDRLETAVKEIKDILLSMIRKEKLSYTRRESDA